jgi:hypothetical protein
MGPELLDSNAGNRNPAESDRLNEQAYYMYASRESVMGFNKAYR